VAREPRYAKAAGASGGVFAIDGGPWSAPIGPADVRAALDVLVDAYPMTVLDIGNDATPAAREALGAAHRIVLVTSLAHTALDAAETLLVRLADTPAGRSGQLVIAVVLTRRQRAARVKRYLDAHLHGEHRWVVVPYDRAAARGGALDPARMRGATRAAFETLAGLLTSD
jgi:Flp pilus assembly CpaE family ATPase